MSRGINKVILVGNVCADPECRYLQNGGAVSNLSIATNEEWTDKSTNQKQSKTEYHRVVFFGKLADIVSQYVKKGSKLYVEGKLQTRKWQDQSGQDRYTTEIVVDGFNGVMQMLDSRQDGQSGQAPQQSYQQPAQQPQQMPHQAAKPMQQPAHGMNPNGSQRSPYANNPQSAPPGQFDNVDQSIPF